LSGSVIYGVFPTHAMAGTIKAGAEGFRREAGANLAFSEWPMPSLPATGP
jgi:hypothetical protein